MINKKNYLQLLLLMFLTTSSLMAQNKLSSKDEKELLKKAESYYYDEELQNIPKALEYFQELAKNKPEDPYYRLMEGICYTHFRNKKELALSKLLEVKQKNPSFNEVNYYLARAYAVNKEFDKAIETYELYMSSTEVAEEQKAKARQNIIYCQNAKKFTSDSLVVDIVNIGAPINTEHSEYVPVITSDETVLIFTYRGDRSKGGLMDKTGKPDPRGEYYEDIMISYKVGSSWLEPESIGDNINANGHDASIALSVDGQQLFIYKSTKQDNGDIYTSVLNGDSWSKPEKLKGEVNTEAWEGSASLSSDGKKLYFSSNREGGFGGRDLYSADLNPDGSWGNVKNLGPVINTKHDDDAPFIHPDRRTMYYSSKGHNSMGGYDIFYTYLNDDGWDEPANIGYPVNTIDDDRYYVLSADAKTGYYSTAGRSENGTHDIYTVSPGHFGKRPILALVVGVVNADGKPADADITVTNDKTGELEGKFKSNSSSGKYMLALTPGNKYKIAIEVEGYDTKIDYIDVQSLETYVQVEHDFNFGGKQIVEEVAASKEDVLQGKIDSQIEKYKKESTKEGYEEMVYKKILKEEGEIQADGIQYFVEAPLGKEGKLKGIPTQEFNYADGSVKTMAGPYSSLLAAEVARQELIKSDSTMKLAAVKVNDNGQEKSIKQYYSKQYSRTEFLKDVNIHDQLTGVEPIKPTDDVDTKSATDLVENKDVNLENKQGLEDAAGKNIAGLSFKVEIGAVTNPDEFKLGHLEKYGKITAKTYPDGITRYTFGPFETLDEAESFRQMVIAKEKAAEDAFVTVFVFGQRKTLDELTERQKDDLGIKEPTKEKPLAQAPCNEEFVDFSFFIGKDLNDKAIYNKLIATGGKSCASGLEFRVQIAAYRFPKNYKWNHLKKYGEPLVKDYPDGITRFTQGLFNTLGEAEVLRQQIIKSGQKDAWITPFYNGKRMLLEELIQNNFYGKTIN
ncbi:MAG: PD40 domain-containing protein [Flavobacteriales bacterium]|nr:PD40 domain-containing protein [Flavobacteriales bacterium]